MFTPQRSGSAGGWLFRAAHQGSGASRSLKGKADADSPLPAPPAASLAENGDDCVAAVDGFEMWRLTRTPFDEASLRRKDREALIERVAEIEKELYEYQFNMGLLLIEKKDWAAKFDEMNQTLTELQELLKREQASHVVAISELEAQAENLRKALGIEKQCVVDLEKALHEMRTEIAEVKFTSERKISEALTLQSSLEEKKLEIESLSHALDAKLAESNRKRSLLDRSSEELEARERRLKTEKSAFETERSDWRQGCADREDYLHTWELQIKERENRVAEERSSFSDRERSLIDREILLKKKEEDIANDIKRLEALRGSLKSKEDDVNSRQRSLASSEKDIESRKINLERKEKELLDREENLKKRETAGLQKLFDDHKADLEAKKKAFELDIQKQKASFNEELKKRTEDVEKKEKNNNLRERELSNKEQALETGWQKLREKERDLGANSIELQKREESVRDAEKKVKEEQANVIKDIKSLENSKLELQNLKASIEAEKNRLIEEKESLKVTENDRVEHNTLVAKLKQEIEEYRAQTDAVLKEKEDLKKGIVELEGEWEISDRKKVDLEAQKKELDDEREKFKRWCSSEENRLKQIAVESDSKFKKEREDLELAKQAFEEEKKHERLEIEDLLKRERADSQRNLQLHKHQLEMEMENRLAAREKELQQKEIELRQKLDFSENKIRYAVEINESKIQKIIAEKEQLQKEKGDLLEDKQKLETERLEIKKDIQSLTTLSWSLKERREEYLREKNRFVTLAENCKVCKNCGVTVIDELDLLALQDTENLRLPSILTDENHRLQNTDSSPQAANMQQKSGGRLSWFSKYSSKIFKFSPGKRAEQSSEQEPHIPFADRLDREALNDDIDYEPTPVFELVNEPFGAQELGSNSGVRENEDHENNYEVAGDTELLLPERGQLEVGGKPKSVKKYVSVKRVVQEAKVILGEPSAANNGGSENGVVNDHSAIQEDSQEYSITTSLGKRTRVGHTSEKSATEQEAEDSEAQSDTVSVGARRSKRRQTSGASTPTVGEKRYNLRQHTNKNANAAAPVPLPGKNRASKRRAGAKVMAEGTSEAREPFAESTKTAVLNQNSVEGGIVEIHEFIQTSSQVEAMSIPVEDNGDDIEEVPTVPEAAPSTPPGVIPEEDEDDNDEDEEDDKQNLSVGKKLWKFLTT